MTEFPHDRVKPFTGPKSKKQQVGEMFDAIARRYDFMNRFLSVGIDVIWRKKAIRRLAAENPQCILDVATGTGDMAIMAAEGLRPQKIVGIDISEKMLEIGRRKVTQAGLNDVIELLYGDSETINFPNETFDAVMVAFGVRNFENLEKGLAEIFRVMKRGGKLVVLEFSQPRIPGVRELYNLYCGIIAPEIAGWFRQNKKAYQYLNKSTRAFPDRRAFTAVLESVGFTETLFKTLSLGICCIYTAIKP